MTCLRLGEYSLPSSRLGVGVDTLLFWEPSAMVEDWETVEDRANDSADRTLARMVRNVFGTGTKRLLKGSSLWISR
jgi:hypothetical protein